MMEWRSIETAPKDGSKFLAVWPETQGDPQEIDVTYWKDDNEFTGWASGNFWANTNDANPICWMPLPEPPKGYE